MRLEPPEIRDGSHTRCRPAIAGMSVLLALALSPCVAHANDDAKRQFLTSCGVCHAIEKDAAPRQGPNLLGIIGRKAGQVPEFKYSEALAKADLTWDEATLDRWIEDAAAVQPGTVMAYRQRDPDKRKLIIAYLKTLVP